MKTTPNPIIVSYGTYETERMIANFERALHALGEELPPKGPWYIHDLYIKLKDSAPEGFHFDSHPKDKTLFGFWPNKPLQ